MAGLEFTWLRNLGAMIDNGTEIQVSCTLCKVYRNFTTAELVALADKVGREFDLRNRRCRCRLTEGCRGWNWFHYLNGVFRPLSDPDRRAFWPISQDG